MRNPETETEYEKKSGEYGRECKLEYSHRDKTEQWQRYIYSKVSLLQNSLWDWDPASLQIITFFFARIQGYLFASDIKMHT